MQESYITSYYSCILKALQLDAYDGMSQKFVEQVEIVNSLIQTLVCDKMLKINLQAPFSKNVQKD